MGSDEIELVSSQRIEYFRPQSHEFGRGIYDSSNREERPVNNIEEDDEDELEEDDDDGDGEIEGLVAVDENAKNKSSTGSVQSSSDKTNLQNTPSSFVPGRSILAKENGIVPSPLNIRGCYGEQQFQRGRINNYANAITISDSEIYCTNMLQGQTSSNAAAKEIGGENGCRFNGGRDIALYTDSGVSLRSILSDPITGCLMDDAMILPCGHSFGSGGLQHVLRMKVCCTCSQSISGESVAPNLATSITVGLGSISLILQKTSDTEIHDKKLSCFIDLSLLCSFLLLLFTVPILLDTSLLQESHSYSLSLALRSAVDAFRREEEMQCSRLSKRRRDRYDQDKCYGDVFPLDCSRGKGVQFPFAVTDHVIIKGNKRTPQRFVGREAVVTMQCLNGWYVVKTLDNAESVKLQYRSLAKLSDNLSPNLLGNKSTPNWL